MKEEMPDYGNGVLPAHAPSYPVSWHCSSSHMITITVEGNESEMKQILSYTPFEFVSPLYQIWFCNLDGHTLDKSKNGYRECAITIPASYKGHVGGFTPYIYCTCIPAILAGREIYGYPKQYADITWIETTLAVACSVRKDGAKLLKASFVYNSGSDGYRDEIEILEKQTAKRLLFKTMPSAFTTKSELAQVILRDTGRKTTLNKRGLASLEIGTLESDPISRLGVLKILGAKFTESNYGGESNSETKTLLAAL
jgi:acetoacetate decarboxylase